MHVSATTQAPGESDDDTVVLGIFDGDGAPEHAPAEVGALLASGEARTSFRSLALAHAAEKRWLLVGLGEQSAFTPERARVAATAVRDRARELSAVSVCWEAPHDS